jgi:hypothetical protein
MSDTSSEVMIGMTVYPDGHVYRLSNPVTVSEDQKIIWIKHPLEEMYALYVDGKLAGMARSADAGDAGDAGDGG